MFAHYFPNSNGHMGVHSIPFLDNAKKKRQNQEGLNNHFMLSSDHILICLWYSTIIWRFPEMGVYP